MEMKGLVLLNSGTAKLKVTYSSLNLGCHNVKYTVPEPFEFANSKGISLKYFDLVVDSFGVSVCIGAIKGVQDLFLPVSIGIKADDEFRQLLSVSLCHHAPDAEPFSRIMTVFTVHHLKEFILQGVSVTEPL